MKKKGEKVTIRAYSNNVNLDYDTLNGARLNILGFSPSRFPSRLLTACVFVLERLKVLQVSFLFRTGVYRRPTRRGGGRAGENKGEFWLL